jgi:hypothetical protein
MKGEIKGQHFNNANVRLSETLECVDRIGVPHRFRVKLTPRKLGYHLINTL